MHVYCVLNYCTSFLYSCPINRPFLLVLPLVALTEELENFPQIVREPISHASRCNTSRSRRHDAARACFCSVKPVPVSWMGQSYLCLWDVLAYWKFGMKRRGDTRSLSVYSPVGFAQSCACGFDACVSSWSTPYALSLCCLAWQCLLTWSAQHVLLP
jgi:hypothetical protein